MPIVPLPAGREGSGLDQRVDDHSNGQQPAAHGAHGAPLQPGAEDGTRQHGGQHNADDSAGAPAAAPQRASPAPAQTAAQQLPHLPRPFTEERALFGLNLQQQTVPAAPGAQNQKSRLVKVVFHGTKTRPEDSLKSLPNGRKTDRVTLRLSPAQQLARQTSPGIFSMGPQGSPRGSGSENSNSKSLRFT
jgi:hypothetical protein